MQIFIIMCVTLVPDTVLSRAFRSERRNVTAVTNTERSSTKFHILQPRKRASRNKRPTVYIKEKGPVKLTKRPTNSKQVRLFGRVGLFLYVNANGSVSGSLNQHSQFVKFELQSFGPSIVRIRSIETGKFLSIDSEGTLQTRKDATDECLFYENHEENLFVSFASYKYYMSEHYDMFLGIKRSGEFKQPTSTLPGQDSTQFIVLSANHWGLARINNIGG